MKIEKLRLYLESTMFNYYFDAARDGHAYTVRLFEAIGTGKYDGYTSEYAVYELLDSSEPKRTNMLRLIEKYGIIGLNISEESDRMADLCVQNKIIPRKYKLDAAHIAIASIHGLDCVLSFNFQHINKLKTKRMTESINLSEGYKGIIICTPMEVLDDEQEYD